MTLNDHPGNSIYMGFVVDPQMPRLRAAMSDTPGRFLAFTEELERLIGERLERFRSDHGLLPLGEDRYLNGKPATACHTLTLPDGDRVTVEVATCADNAGSQDPRLVVFGYAALVPCMPVVAAVMCDPFGDALKTALIRLLAEFLGESPEIVSGWDLTLDQLRERVKRARTQQLRDTLTSLLPDLDVTIIDI